MSMWKSLALLFHGPDISLNFTFHLPWANISGIIICWHLNHFVSVSSVALVWQNPDSNELNYILLCDCLEILKAIWKVYTHQGFMIMSFKWAINIAIQSHRVSVDGLICYSPPPPQIFGNFSAFLRLDCLTTAASQKLCTLLNHLSTNKI